MASVSKRARAFKQPKGGYISPKSFKVIEKNNDKLALGEAPENLEGWIVGTAVDYLTRTLLASDPLKGFKISLLGAKLAREGDLAIKKAESITDLSAKSIVTACKLVGYDNCYRAGKPPVKNIMPDENTIKNIEIMVNRALQFFNEYGPITKDGFTFEGGYTNIVRTGDGDFITTDTLWDFKVSKYEPKSEHTLQLLMYYLMGLRSIYEDLHRIKHLGIFNPRLNKVYLLNVSDISPKVIEAVEKDVIGY